MMFTDPANLNDAPGPWFSAAFAGECSRGGEEFEAGEEIRADGHGEWECRECVEEAVNSDAEPLEGDGFPITW